MTEKTIEEMRQEMDDDPYWDYNKRWNDEQVREWYLEYQDMKMRNINDMEFYIIQSAMYIDVNGNSWDMMYLRELQRDNVVKFKEMLRQSMDVMKKRFGK